MQSSHFEASYPANFLFEGFIYWKHGFGSSQVRVTRASKAHRTPSHTVRQPQDMAEAKKNRSAHSGHADVEARFLQSKKFDIVDKLGEGGSGKVYVSLLFP